MAFFAENEYLGLQNGVKRLKTAKFCFIREILLFACLAGVEFAFFPVDALDGFCSRMFFYFFTFNAPFLPFKVFRPEAQMYYLMQIMFLCRSVFSLVRLARFRAIFLANRKYRTPEAAMFHVEHF